MLMWLLTSPLTSNACIGVWMKVQPAKWRDFLKHPLSCLSMRLFFLISGITKYHNPSHVAVDDITTWLKTCHKKQNTGSVTSDRFLSTLNNRPVKDSSLHYSDPLRGLEVPQWYKKCPDKMLTLYFTYDNDSFWLIVCFGLFCRLLWTQSF